MKLSVIVPAFNEEKYLAATLRQLRTAFDAHRERLGDYELIVCDNNSTDRTAEVAAEQGATVVFEPHNQISRARNSGARDARGAWLLFVDADTHVPEATITDLLDHIDSDRYVGGGCDVQLDGGGRVAHVIIRSLVHLFRWARMAGGAFVFCRAQAFRAVDGFSEDVYAGEEVFFSRAIKRWGRSRRLKFAFLMKHPVRTSARKLDTHGLATVFRLGIRGIFLPRSTIGSRKHLDFFYDGKR